MKRAQYGSQYNALDGLLDIEAVIDSTNVSIQLPKSYFDKVMNKLGDAVVSKYFVNPIYSNQIY
jgi:ABC-type sulfate transport system substrate-binding protein